MAIRVTLTNKSQQTSKLTHPRDGDTQDIMMSRAIYQTLGSLINNKEIATRQSDGKYIIHWEKLTAEYSEFLNDLNDLFLKVNYPLLSQDIVVKDGIVELDEYLGSLGVDREYAYNKDVVDIPPWAKSDTQAEIRVLMDEDDNTYLTDSNGTEVLVRII